MYICSVCVQVWVGKCVQRRERERERGTVYYPCLTEMEIWILALFGRRPAVTVHLKWPPSTNWSLWQLGRRGSTLKTLQLMSLWLPATILTEWWSLGSLSKY